MVGTTGCRGFQSGIRALYSFREDAGGSYAAAPVTVGPDGSLYGYISGGTWGTVFQLLPPSNDTGKWKFQILYTFKDKTDGNLLSESSPLIWKDGALYGIASPGRWRVRSLWQYFSIATPYGWIVGADHAVFVHGGWGRRPADMDRQIPQRSSVIRLDLIALWWSIGAGSAANGGMATPGDGAVWRRAGDLPDESGGRG